MSEASRRPAHDAGPAPAQASSIATRPPIPRLPVGRLAFLLLAGIALLAGLDASRPWPRRAWGACTDSS